MKYHPRYCEENVWHLLGDAEPLELAEAFAVVISNPRGRVAMWHQREVEPGEVIAWDYHVVVIAESETGGQWQLWDFDTRLGFPIDLHVYLLSSFATVGIQPPEFDPLFRVLPAADFRAHLCSDRSHMRDERGEWLRPPPPWPMIGTGQPNLNRLRDMSDPFLGEITDLRGLIARFG